MSAIEFQPGNIVRARGREWVVLPHSVDDILHLRPIGGGDDSPTQICVPLERLPGRACHLPATIS